MPELVQKMYPRLWHLSKLCQGVRDVVGDLDLIGTIDHMQEGVRSAADFTELPQVIDNASMQPGRISRRQPRPTAS
jgi:hypothetical protein